MHSQPPWASILNVPWPCTADDIKSAFRSLARRTHPDHGGDDDTFRAVVDAYRQAITSCSSGTPVATTRLPVDGVSVTGGTLTVLDNGWSALAFP